MSDTRKYRKFTAQQKTEIVLASLRGPKSMTELCREHDIADSLLRTGASSSSPPVSSACRARPSGLRPTSCVGRSPGSRGLGPQDDGGRDRGGTLAGLGQAARVA